MHTASPRPAGKCHLLGSALLVLWTLQTASSAVLTHRYSFATDASDSINGANGTLQGNAAIINGVLNLDGTNSSVRLPNNLFSNYASVSFELWYADGPVSSPTAQLYNFSGAAGGMNYYLFGQGAYYLGTTTNLVSLPAPAVGGTNHVIWTQDGVSQTAQIYVNGLLAGQTAGFTNTPALIGPTTNNLIGAGATKVAASNFKGAIFEFRTYQGALSPLDAAVLDAFGPTQPLTDPGTLQDVRVVIPSPTGPGALFRAGVFADFSGVTNVNISTQPDLVLSSDHTNVIAVASQNQWLQTLTPGTANVTAAWQGFSNTVAVTVGVPQDIALLHRYGFNESANDWIVHDSVGSAHGRVFNTLPLYYPPNAAFTGKGELKLTGSEGSTSGYVGLPSGILSSLSEVSVEAWVTWTLRTAGWPWQRIFDFGSPATSSPNTYFFLTTEANTYTPGYDVARWTISTNGIDAETPRLDWTNILSLNVTSFVAVTYSPVRGIAKFYLNGQLASSGTAVIPLSGIIDTNNWLGRSQYAFDSYFGGRYNEFRMFNGLMSDADVAADYAAGPDTVGVDYVIHSFTSGTNLTLTWGLTATNVVLQSSPALGSGAGWNQVPTKSLVQNGRYQVTVPMSGDAVFFRLHTP